MLLLFMKVFNSKIFWVILLGRIRRILITKWVNEHFTIIDAIKIRLLVQKIPMKMNTSKFVSMYACIHTQNTFPWSRI